MMLAFLIIWCVLEGISPEATHSCFALGLLSEALHLVKAVFCSDIFAQFTQ